MEWNIALDEFGFKIADLNKPNTMRDVLATISSVFDPLNFAAPVSCQPNRSCKVCGVAKPHGTNRSVGNS